jgi:hypothetical protein
MLKKASITLEQKRRIELVILRLFSTGAVCYERQKNNTEKGRLKKHTKWEGIAASTISHPASLSMATTAIIHSMNSCYSLSFLLLT